MYIYSDNCRCDVSLWLSVCATGWRLSERGRVPVLVTGPDATGASARGAFLGGRVATTIPSASLFQLDFQVEL